MYSSLTFNSQNQSPFEAFGLQRHSLIGRHMMLYPEKASREPVRDTLLEEVASGVTSRRVMGLFLLGVGAGLVGRRPLGGLFKVLGLSLRKIGIPLNENIFRHIKSTQHESAVLTFTEMNAGLPSLAAMVHMNPGFWRSVVGYIGTAIMGYAAGSFAQGAQEAWVRREETKIRAKLINQLTRVFTQSIRAKNQSDNQLRGEAKARVLALLNKYGIPDAERYLAAGPLSETPATHLRAFYQPTNRTEGASSVSAFAGLWAPPSAMSPQTISPVPSVMAAAPHLPINQPPDWRRQPVGMAGAVQTGAPPLRFGQSIEECLSGWAEDASNADGWHAGLLQTVVGGLGVATGLALGMMGKLIGSAGERTFQGKANFYHNINLNGWEGMALRGFARRENLPFMAGFFLLAGLGKLGKLFVDGLREIEVTRANARTELSYQGHLWLTQDPHYHGIAVQEAMENELSQLDQELASGLRNPAAIKQRVDSILAVSLKAAPPYWPMIPSVQLVAARG